MKLVQLSFFISILVVATSGAPNLIEHEDSVNSVAKRWIPFEGKIEVRNVHGQAIGFVSKKLSNFGTYVADPDDCQAAVVSFSALKSEKSTGLLIKDTTANRTQSSFLGGVVRAGASLSTPPKSKREEGLWKRQGPSPPNVPVIGSGPTSPGQPPVTIPNTFSPGGSNPTRKRDGESCAYEGESAIWSFDPETKTICASWTNPDGCTVTVLPYYNPCLGVTGVTFVSDPDTYLAQHPHAFPVSLNFASN